MGDRARTDMDRSGNGPTDKHSKKYRIPASFHSCMQPIPHLSIPMFCLLCLRIRH